jgi:GT2 family glycosyltransferase
MKKKAAVALPLPSSPPGVAREYLFHLDLPPHRITFGSCLTITGWLFHRTGKPIHGLRAMLKPRGRRARIYKARRKRARPALGAAYPHLPDAGSSGFLIEIDDLPLGGFDLRIEVRDQEKIWQTIFETRSGAVPFSLVRRLGFPRFQATLARQLQERFPRRPTDLALAAGEQEEIRRAITAAQVERSRKIERRTVAIEKIHLFVTSKSNLFIVEIAQLVCAGFREAGFAAELFVDCIPAEETPNDTIQIVVTPHEFYNLFLTPTLPPERVRRLTQNLFLLGTEQPESDWFHSNLVIAPYARVMLDINPLGVKGYRAHGLRCFHLPLGYHALLEQRSSTTPLERDLDVCLLASLTERRETFLATHADFFAAHNCHLRLVPIGFAKTESTKSYLSAEARNELLQRTKILLNVHYWDLRYFEWHRMLIGLANGCCIITETCEGFAPLVPGKHFVMVELEELVRCCQYYLEHPDERAAIARAGHEFVRQYLTQTNNCRQCIQQITRGEEALLGADSADPTNHRHGTQHSGMGPGSLRLLGQAFRQDLHNLFRPEEGPAVPDPETAATTVATIRERRRGYAERFARQEEVLGAGAEAWRISDNNHFREITSPSISIIVTLYNYENYIGACVRSVEPALLSALPGAIEILIVDDASTDSSLDHARETQRQSALPIRIVEKKFNTGLADARNVGLSLARAPYAFIMDADNLIFPGALEELYKAITESGAAATYSILCRFRGQPNNRTGLLSYFDWDPQMLVEHPYIDAMALFDRQQLLALGGYDNELFKIGWFGWEDYELWLRMAAAHLRATLVPNILCLYRHHESAMSRTTNLFEIDLVRHLIARYQPLIDEYPPKKQIFGVEWTRLTNSQPASTAAPSPTSS